MNRIFFSTLFFWGSIFVGYLVLPFLLFLHKTLFALPLTILISIISFLSPFLGTLLVLPLISWFSYIDILHISPWNYLVITTILGCFIGFHWQKNQVQLWSRWSILISMFLIISIGYISAITFVHTGDGNRSVLEFLKLSVTLLFALSLGFTLNTKRRIIVSLSFFTITIFISSIVGAFQFLQLDNFWRLRELLPIDPEIAYQIASRYRITGLAAYNIPFTYQLVIATPLTLSLLFCIRKKHFFWIFLSIFLVLMFGLFASLSRSAVAASLIGVSLTYLQIVGVKKFLKILFVSIVMMVAVVGTLTMSTRNPFERLTITGGDINTFARLPAAKLALEIGITKPFGVSQEYIDYYRYLQRSNYLATFYDSIEKNMAQRVADIPTFLDYTDGLPITPHNQFLNMLVYYGIPGFLIITLFYFLPMGGNIVLRRGTNNAWIYSISAGINGSLMSYILHSSLHNNGPFFDDPLSWYLVGLSLALYNYSAAKPNGKSNDLTKHLD